MKILVIATRNPDRAPEDFAPFLQAEAKMALTFRAEDFIREIYSRADGKGAVLVAEAENEAQVYTRLSALPLAKAGLLSFEFYPLMPYRGITLAADLL